ncbi:ABC transporter permease [Phycicoccus sp. SLBN-51]|jgi:simple sugar transport system permease protein|uniref:ABC transporter permease n=1 Tax=Phycicoccus sp. SLBN-51 TaxID=2768447 RepID=UPI0011517961|nr:ABC transporter permease [Phycicoccus sp. SLBN-51]TQJ51871.1 nucleoside ABC transporter membrane protein [Phycicoccus sp. SLBN-51]
MSAAGLSVGVQTEHAAPPAKRRHLSPARLALYAAAVVLVISILRVVTGANDIASSGAIAAAIGLAVPIGLAGLGGLWSERAGVVNIGLEGMMILGTWGAAFCAIHWGAWAGIIGGIIGGVVGGVIHAVATVVFGVDHIVSGVALNIIGAGLAKYLAARFFTGMQGGGPTQSPPLPELPTVSLPGISDALGTLEQKHIFFISDLAGIIRGFVTNVSVLTIIAVLLFVATAWILWRSAFGLRLRSCGESPVAAESLGINVYRYKFMAVLVSGGLAGLGGGFLALVAANVYRDGQTGGRGYIGLAAMIFGNWRPGGLMAGAGLFGYTDAIQLRGGGATVHALLLLLAVLLLAIGIWQIVRNKRMIQGGLAIVTAVLTALWYVGTETVPSELVGITPYLTTLLVLAFASQRLRMPAADGQVYRKGEGH